MQYILEIVCIALYHRGYTLYSLGFNLTKRETIWFDVSVSLQTNECWIVRNTF